MQPTTAVDTRDSPLLPTDSSSTQRGTCPHTPALITHDTYMHTRSSTSPICCIHVVANMLHTCGGQRAAYMGWHTQISTRRTQRAMQRVITWHSLSTCPLKRVRAPAAEVGSVVTRRRAVSCRAGVVGAGEGGERDSTRRGVSTCRGARAIGRRVVSVQGRRAMTHEGAGQEGHDSYEGAGQEGHDSYEGAGQEGHDSCHDSRGCRAGGP